LGNFRVLAVGAGNVPRGCATETSYQAPEYRFEYKYYRAPTSGGAMIGPPPEAGG
jgi:hypothetical protein